MLDVIVSIAFNFAFLLIALEDQKKGTVYDWHCYVLVAIALCYAFVKGVAFQPVVIPLMLLVIVLNNTQRLGFKKEYFGFADVLVFLAIAVAYPAILAYVLIASMVIAELYVRWKRVEYVHFIPFIFILWCVLVTLYYDLPNILALVSSIVR